MLNYPGMYLLPGMGADDFITQEQQVWWGREEQQLVVGGNVDATLVDAGNTSYTSRIRPGLALGYLTASKQFVMWNPYATDGSNALAGFLLGAQEMQFNGASVDRFLGGILTAGNVYASRLLIPGETTYGISGKNYEFLLREQMLGRFQVDDDLGRIMQLKHYPLTGNTTVTTAMNNTLFHYSGGTGDIVVTLPAPVPGLRFGFINQDTDAGDVITLDAPSTNEFLVTAGTSASTVDLAGAACVPRWVRAIRSTTAPLFQYVLEA